MHKKHTDQQVYSSSEVPQSHNAKRTEKIREKKKEQGNTKQEEPGSNSHKATQNKKKTNRLNVEVQLIGLTM